MSNATYKAGNSLLVTPMTPGIHVMEYHTYCLRVMVDALSKLENNYVVGMGNVGYLGDSAFTFDAQYEHTLVHENGRSVDEVIFGKTDLINGDGKYLVRIPNYDYYSNLSGTFEYSVPNIINIGTNDLFKDYLNTAMYMAPVIYEEEEYTFSKNRDGVFTLFSQNASDNRTVFAVEANQLGININYINGAFTKEDLRRVYNKHKIMVNVHQTPHHHTFEELRCLPALINGVIVVSEEVPLKEHIPYHKHIVWSDRDNLASTVKHVQENYEDYHKQIFTKELPHLIRDLHGGNLVRFKNLFDKLRSRS